MPNSFSRFLSEEELLKVRELYLQSVDAAADDPAQSENPSGDTGPSSDNA